MLTFKNHSILEWEIIRILAYCGGISKKHFLETSDQTTLAKYITKGLIKECPDTEPDFYQITDKFKRAYLSLDPSHTFLPVESTAITAILYNALKLIPPTAAISNERPLKISLTYEEIDLMLYFLGFRYMNDDSLTYVQQQFMTLAMDKLKKAQRTMRGDKTTLFIEPVIPSPEQRGMDFASDEPKLHFAG